MLSTFVERWHSETSSFHLLHGNMSIIFDVVSSLLHLSIRGKLLYHSRMTRLDPLDMMVTYLEVDPSDFQKEMDDTRRCHARFLFLEKLYIYHLNASVKADGDDA